MEEPQSGTRSYTSPPVQMGMDQDWRPPIVSPTGGDEAVPRRLEWIAVVLFIVSFFTMMFSVSIFLEDESWSLAIVVISTATGIILLLSVIFSIFGRTDLSRIFLGGGIVGLIVLVVLYGAKLMQTITEYHDRWFY